MWNLIESPVLLPLSFNASFLIFMQISSLLFCCCSDHQITESTENIFFCKVINFHIIFLVKDSSKLKSFQCPEGRQHHQEFFQFPSFCACVAKLHGGWGTRLFGIFITRQKSYFHPHPTLSRSSAHCRCLAFHCRRMAANECRMHSTSQPNQPDKPFHESLKNIFHVVSVINNEKMWKFIQAF